MATCNVWNNSVSRAGALLLQGMQRVFWGLLVVLPLQQAQAFDSPEHEKLGDTAVKAVMQLYQCDQAGSAHAEACATLKQVDGSQPDVPRYGEVVACVDYFLTPEKLMAQYDESGNHMISAWPHQSCYDPKSMATKLVQASHSNHTHFQKELLVSLDTYHQLAMSMARDNHNLAGALFVNAIGDHYLQDFFAPGHITVRRSQITDLFANAMHDAANVLGATLHQGEGAGNARMQQAIAAIQGAAAGTSPDALAIRNFLAGDANCMANPQVFAAGGVQLEGDGKLGRADGCGQRIVMLAANVISIEDVLQAAQGAQQANYYDDYAFSYVKRHAGPWWSLDHYRPDIYAKLPFGYYALGTNKNTSSDNDRDLPFAREFVWGVSVAREQFSTGTGVARTSTLLEFVPFGKVGDGFFSNYGIAVGAYHYEASGEATGNGGSIRIGFIVPETESTFSVGYRRVYHTGPAVNEWGSGLNFRFDQGYTSFLSLFLSLGRDYGAENDSQLAYGTYFSAGLMFAAPTSRIKACLKLNCM
jgi:hypothetical protein